MGQYANQPDFITNDIQAVTPVLAANLTAADSLNGSVLYIGNSTGGSLQVIPAGTTGASVVTELVSPGYAGSGGSGYVQGTEYDLLGGSGTALAAEFNVVNGAIVSVIDITSGTTGGYLNGDLVTVDGGDGKATLRVVASPGLPGAAQAVEFDNVPQGEWFPVVVDYVLADNTTASGIIAGK
tara:strand:- start:39 stop:584 length:546 start_codon:yes stop_codon:yes gene_type:complete